MKQQVLRALIMVVAVCSTALLGSCDSNDSMLPGGGGTGTPIQVLAIGPITGFGSVIVNGIVYNDSSAILLNEQGDTISPTDLRLGTVVEVQGERTTDGGIANTITTFSELKGVVENVDGNTIIVNGTRVLLVNTTVYYEATNLVIGDQIEVFGAYDTSREAVIATRIEGKSLDNYKLRGTVSGLDTNAEQFNLGNTRISYSGIVLPENLANGISVRVYSNTVPDSGVWPITEIRLTGSDRYGNGNRIEVEGVISQLTNTQNFVVNGFQIDASNASISDGVASDIAVGRLVEVKGTISGTKLIAESIEFEDTSSSTPADTTFRVTDTIKRFESISDFTVRNVIVDASQVQRIDDGAITDLMVGACIEVRGGLADNGINSVLLARIIKFEDDCD